MSAGGNHEGAPRTRPLGIRQALAQSFLAALEADFQENAAKVLREIREKRTHDYLKIIVGLLPDEVVVEENILEALTDGQLAAVLRAVNYWLAERGEAPLRDADGAPGGAGAP